MSKESFDRMDLAFGVMEAAGLPLPYGMDRGRMIELWSVECEFASAQVLTYVARKWATTKFNFPCLAEFLDEVRQVDYASTPHCIVSEGRWWVLDLATDEMRPYEPSPEQIANPILDRPPRLSKSDDFDEYGNYWIDYHGHRVYG